MKFFHIFGNCRLQLQPLGEARLSQYSVSFFSSLTKNIKIITEDNKIPTEDVEVELIVSCSPSINHEMKVERFKIIDKNSDSTYSSLIRQFVHDKKHNIYEPICYDLRGHDGYFVEIFNYNSGRSTIFGQYVNGDYLNRLIISSPIGRIVINVETISFDSDHFFKWGIEDTPKLHRFTGYLIENHGNFIILDTINNSLFLKAKILISRKIHEKSQTYYLEISIENLISYTGVTGIIGSVGQNIYNFYGSSTDNLGFEKAAIFNNVHFTTGLKLQREGSDCWLLDVKDAVYPNAIDNFLWEDDQDEVQEFLAI